MEKRSERPLSLIGLPVYQQQGFLLYFIVEDSQRTHYRLRSNKWTRNILKNKSVKMDSLAPQRGKFVKFYRVTMTNIASFMNSILLPLKRRQENK